GAAPDCDCCAAASIEPAASATAAVLTRRNVRPRRGAGSVMVYPSKACGPCTARLGNRSGSGVWLIAGLRAALFLGQPCGTAQRSAVRPFVHGLSCRRQRRELLVRERALGEEPAGPMQLGRGDVYAGRRRLPEDPR